MKSFFKKVAAAATVVAVSATAGFAGEAKKDAEHKFEKAAGYYTECTGATSAEFQKIKPKIKAFTDAELMAETLNDPERLAELSAIVNDPHTIHVMASCATEPVMWDTWMRNGTDFNKMAASLEARNASEPTES